MARTNENGVGITIASSAQLSDPRHIWLSVQSKALKTKASIAGCTVLD